MNLAGGDTVQSIAPSKRQSLKSVVLTTTTKRVGSVSGHMASASERLELPLLQEASCISNLDLSVSLEEILVPIAE